MLVITLWTPVNDDHASQMMIMLKCHEEKCKLKWPTVVPENACMSDAVLQQCAQSSRVHISGCRKCARCLTVRYCDESCQKKHWATHRLVCHARLSIDDAVM